LGAVPEWAMTNQDGAAVGSRTLAGKVWVANFLFTSCPTSCPPLARATARLQGLIEAWAANGEVPIVSISVDPETDTPERLREFGKTYGQHPKVWHLATSGNDYAAMEQLVVRGFMQPVLRSDKLPSGEVPEGKPTPLDTAHSLRFVLVGPDGHIRGLFDKDDAGLEQLAAAARALARR
jgi:protein SCO1/2